jgi:hypothetical protein
MQEITAAGNRCLSRDVRDTAAEGMRKVREIVEVRAETVSNSDRGSFV